MLKSLKYKIAALVATFAFAFAPVVAPVAMAQEIKDNLKCGSNFSLTGGNCNTDTQEGADNVQTAIERIVNILSIIVGIVAVIMIVFGGFRYITSGGDSTKVGSAKNTIIYAIVGLVIVAFAQFIVQFVLTNIEQ